MDRLITFLAASLTILPGLAMAHGTQGWLEEKEALCLVAQYDDGEPMRFGEVTVALVGEEEAFQAGRTDRQGRFFFSPDRQGKWRVTVNDGLGHRLVLSKRIGAMEEESVAPPRPDSRRSMLPARVEGALVGFALLFGAAGVGYGLRQRRLRRGV